VCNSVYIILINMVCLYVVMMLWVFYSRWDTTYFEELDFVVCEHMRKLGYEENEIQETVNHYDLDDALENDNG
jgi:hypothetical protein